MDACKDKFMLSSQDWALDTYNYNQGEAESAKDELNSALSLSIELEDKSIIDRLMFNKYKALVLPRTYDIVNAIWVAVFGVDAYKGFIDPTFVAEWGEKVGHPPLLPLDVSAEALADWAEGAGAPVHLVRAVRRGLEQGTIYPVAKNVIGLE
tara:strand:+ start:539 stop:994 length:456 start_codon:yes stop_codon:yes gene_type:complete